MKTVSLLVPTFQMKLFYVVSFNPLQVLMLLVLGLGVLGDSDPYYTHGSYRDGVVAYNSYSSYGGGVSSYRGGYSGYGYSSYGGGYNNYGGEYGRHGAYGGGYGGVTASGQSYGRRYIG